MSDNKEALNNLFTYREYIEEYIDRIQTILKVHFSEESHIAMQHWIPQIKTGLRDNINYLPRGDYSMDYTLNRIIDKIDNNTSKGVTKYIQ